MQTVHQAVNLIKANFRKPIILSGFPNLSPYVTKDSIGLAMAMRLHCPVETYSKLVAVTTRGDANAKAALKSDGRARSTLAECAEEDLIDLMDKPRLSVVVSSIGAALSNKCLVVKDHLHVHVTANLESRVQARVASDPNAIPNNIREIFNATDALLRKRAAMYHKGEKLFCEKPQIILDLSAQNKTSEQYAEDLIFMIADFLQIKKKQIEQELQVA